MGEVKIPKRFKLHEAAGRFLRIVRGGYIMAVDHASLVYVPIFNPGTRRPLPEAEIGELPEAFVGRPIPPKAMAVAVQGTKGEGLIHFVLGAVEANSGDGKPWVRHEAPTDDGLTEEASVELQAIADRVHLAPLAGRQEVEVVLDAEALVRVSRAIGAGGDGVRIRFHIDQQTGRCDTDRGLIEVRPAKEPSGAAFGVLMAVAVA